MAQKYLGALILVVVIAVAVVWQWQRAQRPQPLTVAGRVGGRKSASSRTLRYNGSCSSATA